MHEFKLLQILLETSIAVFVAYLQKNIARNTEITKDNLQEIKDFKNNYLVVSQNSIRCVHDLKDMVRDLSSRVPLPTEPADD